METLHIIKIGGNVIDDAELLSDFIKDFAAISGPKILVHGGGKLATQLAGRLGVKQTLIGGRRVTDAETLEIAVMVYAGYINKTVVARLQAQQCMAIGFCGADGNLVKSKKRAPSEIDFGFVGDIEEDGVNREQFLDFLYAGITPVISPITHDGAGNLLNTNADSMVTEIAVALKSHFNIKLIYCFEKSGVLTDVTNESSYIPSLCKLQYTDLKTNGKVSEGMIPKLDNGFRALESGVSQVVICHARAIKDKFNSITGTKLVNL